MEHTVALNVSDNVDMTSPNDTVAVAQVENMPMLDDNNNDNVIRDLLALFQNYADTVELDDIRDICSLHCDLVNFNTKTISVNVVVKTKIFEKKDIVADVFKMIRFYVQLGDDLEYMEKHLPTQPKNEILGLIKKYDLVSVPTNDRSMTLSRVCESFPTQTCIYQCMIPNPLVPNELIKSIISDYPKIMTTTAFAYFIPNTNDAYCTLLKEAHMVYRYILYFITRQGMPYRKISEVVISFEMIVEPEIVVKCLQYTHAAIIRSQISFDKQINMLTTTKLITIQNTNITVAASVHHAAKMWRDIILKVDMTTIEKNLREASKVWEVEKLKLDIFKRK